MSYIYTAVFVTSRHSAQAGIQGEEPRGLDPCCAGITLLASDLRNRHLGSPRTLING